jgi:hypothetical protein
MLLKKPCGGCQSFRGTLFCCLHFCQQAQKDTEKLLFLAAPHLYPGSFVFVRFSSRLAIFTGKK